MASSAGIPFSSYTKYEGDSSTPGGDALAGLQGLGININWLLNESGPMLLPDEAPGQDRSDYVYIPLYDVRAAAGHGAVVDREPVIDVLAFKADWLRQELQAQPSDVRLLFVAGDSMEPDLRAGDIVMIDIRDTGAAFEGYYVLRIDGALLVKQLQRLPGGVIEVSSRNQAYKTFTVKTEQLADDNSFAIIGRVVWACRRV